MISKITLSPISFGAQRNNNNCCGPQKAVPQTTPINFNKELQKDTVSFSGRTQNGLLKETEKEIANAFVRLRTSTIMHNTKLGQIFGTTKSGVDVAVQEIEKGTLARMTLTNGNFPNNTFVGIEIAKDGKIIEIKPMDDYTNLNEAEKFVQTYISTAK